ncbi:MAG: DUF3788 family protein [Candidatus Sericytochromatia bacterium]|nr:DUF3788 family protein [Candidatus Sericytochromatia bacterium]
MVDGYLKGAQMPHPTIPSGQGQPPQRDQLARQLGPRLALWDEACETVLEIGATWTWAFSESTGVWSYRAYQAGNRFFVAMTLTADAFEVSLNLKSEEWDGILATSPAEQAAFDRLRGSAQGEEPAWVHVPVREAADLPMLARILVARARRVQNPRLKGARKRSR